MKTVNRINMRNTLKVFYYTDVIPTTFFLNKNVGVGSSGFVCCYLDQAN